MSTSVTQARRAAEHAAHYQTLLASAQAVFAEKGYHEATIDEIAARAGFAKGTVYNYFDGGKAGLFFTLLDAHLSELHALAVLAFAGEGLSVRVRYAGFVAACAAYFERHRDLLLVHLRGVPLVLHGDDGPYAERLQERQEALVDVLVPPLEAAIARGELRAVPARLTAHLFLSTLLRYLLVSHGTATRTPGSADADPLRASSYLTGLFFRGLSRAQTWPGVNDRDALALPDERGAAVPMAS